MEKKRKTRKTKRKTKTEERRESGLEEESSFWERNRLARMADTRVMRI